VQLQRGRGGDASIGPHDIPCASRRGGWQNRSAARVIDRIFGPVAPHPRCEHRARKNPSRSTIEIRDAQ